MTCYLLDVNVLIALGDPSHLHHERAHSWFGSVGAAEWATCPLTENGFVRIASHPRYPNSPGDASVVVELLRELCSLPGHRFWPDGISVRDLLRPGVAVASGQLTDIYLLGVAISQGGKLATFDARIPAVVLEGGRDALEVLGA